MEALTNKGSSLSGGGGKKDRAPSPAQKALIKRNLGLVYNQALSEDLPQEWLDLLANLPEDKKS